ncbi:MAG: flagellar export protein FliJ [Gammaproteobacteria bacterium]|nr:flagellar export protein FliJ [Gammaproteobacteria bacterium]
MRDRWKRYTGLKNLADNREAQAAKALATSMQQLEMRQAELDRLRSYAAEYQLAQQGKPMDRERLSNLHMFTSQLSGVIKRLEEEVESAKQAMQADMEQWRGGYRHSKALEQLVEKYRRELMNLEESQEQKELDERNARPGDGSATG